MDKTLKNILFLSCHLPYPLLSGGRIREYELLKRISNYFDVNLCVITKTYEEDQSNKKYLQEFCKSVSIYEATNVENVSEDLLNKTPYDVIRNTNSEATQYISNLLHLKKIDLIHVEGYYLFHLIPCDCEVPIVLVEQNIEYTLWEQRYINEKNLKEKEKYYIQYELNKKYEIDAWQRCTQCVTITETDKEYINKILPDKDVKLVPNGVDNSYLLNPSPKDIENEKTYLEHPSILYIGNYGWSPNVDAAKHLCKNILPYIKEEVPNINVYLVGNAPNNELCELSNIPNVHVTGKVESIIPYLESADIFVCSMRIGGGIPVKMIEALFYHKAIVSTTVGAIGLPIIEDGPIIIQDDITLFAKSVIELIIDEDKRKKLEEATNEVIKLFPTWDDASRNLKICYDNLLLK